MAVWELNAKLSVWLTELLVTVFTSSIKSIFKYFSYLPELESNESRAQSKFAWGGELGLERKRDDCS